MNSQTGQGTAAGHTDDPTESSLHHATIATQSEMLVHVAVSAVIQMLHVLGTENGLELLVNIMRGYSVGT